MKKHQICVECGGTGREEAFRNGKKTKRTEKDVARDVDMINCLIEKLGWDEYIKRIQALHKEPPKKMYSPRFDETITIETSKPTGKVCPFCMGEGIVIAKEGKDEAETEKERTES